MRPYIICHMMSSVDGRLDTNQYTQPFDGKSFDSVSNVYFEVSNNFKAQAIMIGRKTVQKHYFKMELKSTTHTHVESDESYSQESESERYTVMLDAKGKVLEGGCRGEGQRREAV